MSKTAGTARAASSDLQRVRQMWDRQAPHFDRAMGFWERLLFAGGRQWVCAQATGTVLEIAAGTARNLPYYHEDVHVTGIDVSPAMLEIGRRRATALGRAIDLRLGDAQALKFPDGSFDTVVCTLSLCSIPDARRAVAEAKRVLRPGGHMLLLEHVRSPIRWIYGLQRLLERLTRRSSGDFLTREPLTYLRAEDFVIEDVQSSKRGIVERIRARKAA